MESRQLLSTVPASILEVKGVSAYVSGSATVNQTPGPFTLSASLVQPNSAYISWTPSADNANYNLCMTSDNWSSWTSLGNFTGTNHVVNNLPMNTTYSFVIYAFNNNGGYWSNTASITTPKIPGTDTVSNTPGPFTLSSIANGPNSINLSWTPSATNVNYNLCMSPDNWKTVISLGNFTTTSYTVNNLSPSTTYSFVIYAFNNYGGAWSNDTSATTSMRTIQTTHPVFHSTDFHYVVGPDSLWSTNPSGQDVHQGSLGDCWLEASLVEIAQRNPDAIKNVFTDLGYYDENGTTVHCWSVRIYDRNYNAYNIIVDNEFAVNSSGQWLANGNGSGQIWASLLEKAYAIAAQNGYVNTAMRPNNDYDCLNYGTASWALQAFTGHQSSQDVFTKDASMNASMVDYYLNNNYYVCLETTNPTSGSIIALHEYSMQLAYPGTYLIDNPWNVPDSGYYGSFFTCDATFLTQNFSGFEFCAI